MYDASAMLFEDVNGGPVARSPKAIDGTVRAADGERYFTLAQAVERFGWTEQQLREHYCTSLGEAALEASGTAAAAPRGPAPEMKPDRRDAPMVGPMTAAADPTLRHYVYGYLDDGELEVFLRLCEEWQVNPWTRDVIPVVETGENKHREVKYITTIAHLRKVGERYGDYRGQLGPFWCGDDGQWVEAWTSKETPACCRVGVQREGRETTWGTLAWVELGIDGQNLPDYYNNSPSYMIGIRAEATALRRAFPNASRLYLRDELARGDRRRPGVSAGGGDQVRGDEEPVGPRVVERDGGQRVVYDTEFDEAYLEDYVDQRPPAYAQQQPHPRAVPRPHARPPMPPLPARRRMPSNQERRGY